MKMLEAWSPDYLQLLKSTYAAPLQTLSFNDPSAAQETVGESVRP